MGIALCHIQQSRDGISPYKVGLSPFMARKAASTSVPQIIQKVQIILEKDECLTSCEIAKVASISVRS